MLIALQTVIDSTACQVEVIDVDSDDALAARYDELVPVLLGQKESEAARELCHHFFDLAAVQDYLGHA